jgi:hypothetical protein
MKPIYILFFLLCMTSLINAQTAEEIEAVQAPIKQLFDGMRAGDSSMVRSAFHTEVSLRTMSKKKEGGVVFQNGDLQKFLEAVGSPHDKVFDERILHYDIRIDGPMATAWTPYSFYRGDSFSHCGVNAFQLVQVDGVWKIFHIADTRRKSGCQEEGSSEETAINKVLDQWHRAAATADEDAFFGAMTEDGIYLGTDATERWLRDELKEWAKKAFERETAWAFTPSNRAIYFAGDGRTAWFEELLDTWMGTCRGSGVLTKTESGWKIKHYNLAVLVPNEKMDAFKELMEK